MEHNDISDQVETFQAIREHNKAEAKGREEKNTADIREWCASNGVHFLQLQPYHLRLMLDTLGI